MSYIEKLGLTIMIMFVSYMSEGGVRGHIYVGMFIAGFFLFLYPWLNVDTQMTDLCPTCGTKRITGESKCRVCVWNTSIVDLLERK